MAGVRGLVWIVTSLFAITCVLVGTIAASEQSDGASSATAAPPPGPPKAKVEVVTDDLHGRKIQDPYRWLENSDSPESQEYVREHRLVDVRLTEQVASGTVEIRDGCVRLTARGVRAAEFSRLFRAQFLPRHRLLGNDYSDDLVDPFRHSTVRNDYLCR